MSHIALKTLWNEYFRAMDMGDLETTVYKITESTHPLAAKYTELEGLKVCEFNVEESDPDDVPEDIDVMVIQHADNDWDSYIPKGVRLVIFVHCSFNKSPHLPASTEVVIYDECGHLYKINLLPEGLRSLYLSPGTEGSERPEATIELPPKLWVLEIEGVYDITFVGPMPDRLQELSLLGVASVLGGGRLPPSLREVHYEAIDEDHYDFGHEGFVIKNEFKLSCSHHLKVLRLEGDTFKVAGHSVSNLEEYHAVCDGRI